MARLAQLQRVDGAFDHFEQIYALVGGADPKGRFDNFRSRPEDDAQLHQRIGLSPSSLKKNGATNEDKKTPEVDIPHTEGSSNSNQYENAVYAQELLSAINTSPWDVIETIWTTLLVLAYMEIKLADEVDMWVIMAEKANIWIISITEVLPPITSSSKGDLDTVTFIRMMETEARKIVEELQ